MLHRKGFTLIETLVAIFIFILIFGVVVSFIVMLYRHHGYTQDQSMAIDEARRGIETMVREIRTLREGDDGSYPIEKAEDTEFIFYSDVDKDGQVERVRYFLSTFNSGETIKDCSTSSKGGSCVVDFSNFLEGNLISAQVKVSVDGDLGAGNEYVEIFANETKLDNVCQSECLDCSEIWQGTLTFDVTEEIIDNFISFRADATNRVDPICDLEGEDYSMRVIFEFSWVEEISGADYKLKKGVIKPSGSPVEYLLDQEEFSIVTSYIRNPPPLFEYFDIDGNKIENLFIGIKDIRLMKVFLTVNVNSNRPPQDFELESWVQIRNLKQE